MSEGGHTQRGSRRFASRRSDLAQATAALDSIVAGWKSLSRFCGRSDAEIETMNSFEQLVEDAAEGLLKYLDRPRRVAYLARLLKYGEACRELIGRAALPASVADRVVAQALRNEVSAGATRLLRIGQASLASTDVLAGIGRLAEMGFILDGQGANWTLVNERDGTRYDLEWSRGQMSRQAAGRLRLRTAMALAD